MDEAKKQYLNFLSIEFLSKLGNDSPSQKQIDLVEAILLKIPLFQNISFDNQLTKREISCLYWAAMGKTSAETAYLLSIKSSTVEQHRYEIKKKLHCDSIAEAVFRGLQLGYIQQGSSIK